ncbi:hypothetical protein HEP81_07377 [Streptomyces griseofuscus]|uniref:Uncharacterized protein n=1 Tax=Streptomyces griseofuscus TaxID=146922 RepID=A0A7H1QBC9_9ACTN|nr:hypothetical protein HEP81_07377 [Streptomyces griseofuscus]
MGGCGSWRSASDSTRDRRCPGCSAHLGSDHDQVASLSTEAQTCGFLLAATGSVLAAALHAATGSWTAPLTALIPALLVCAVAGMRAGHDPG